MSSHAQSRFRVTAWPGGRVPVPLVHRPAAELTSIRVTEDGKETDLVVPAIQHFPVHRQTRLVELPGELALREISDLDDSDPESLLVFTRKYGPLAAVEDEPDHLLPKNTARRFSEDRSLGLLDGLDRQRPEPIRVPIPLITQHVRALRAVIAHWHAYQEGKDKRAIRRAWTDNEFPSDRWDIKRDQGDIEALWALWSDHINAALSPFRTHITVKGPHGVETFEPRTVTAYSAMMLQIANDVADQTVWKVCENETCGHLFGRQQGRDKYGQNRTVGVMYCSKECAHMQAQRKFRRRKAAKGKETQK